MMKKIFICIFFFIIMLMSGCVDNTDSSIDKETTILEEKKLSREEATIIISEYIEDYLEESGLDQYFKFSGFKGTNFDGYARYNFSTYTNIPIEDYFSYLDRIFTDISPFLSTLKFEENTSWKSHPLAEFNVGYKYRYIDYKYGIDEFKGVTCYTMQINYLEFHYLDKIESVEDFYNCCDLYGAYCYKNTNIKRIVEKNTSYKK